MKLRLSGPTFSASALLLVSLPVAPSKASVELLRGLVLVAAPLPEPVSFAVRVPESAVPCQVLFPELDVALSPVKSRATLPGQDASAIFPELAAALCLALLPE